MSLPVLRALLFAGECFAASLLLPVLAFAATALMRRAALRHLTWTTLFGVLAVLPVAALLLPARRIVEHVAAPVVALPVAMPPPAAAPSLFTFENAVLLLVAVWLAGLAWQLLRFAVGGLGLMRLRRASVPFASEIGTGCDVRLAAGEVGPSTFGILRPLILLPRSAEGWPAARLDAVLRHEAAHVARRDTASQFVVRLVCAFYWPNPLLWLGLRAARREAEIAADDAVLASGMTPSAYAAELVALAAQSRGVAPGIAMAQPPLTRRVEAVLAENTSRKGVSRMDIARTVSLGLAATLLLGVARFDIAVAQDGVAPGVEKTIDLRVEKSVDAKVKIKARDAARKAEAKIGAKLKAAAETDPAQQKLLRKEAEKAAVDATRALAAAEEARKAAQDVASTQIRRAMTHTGDPADAVAATRSLAAMEEAERAAKDVASSGIGAMMRHAEVDRAAGEARQRVADARITAEAAGRMAMRAMADAHIDQQVAKAMADAHLSETIARALATAKIDAVTRKAIADAHIEQRIVEAMARVQPQIDAAAGVDAAPAAPPPYAPN